MSAIQKNLGRIFPLVTLVRYLVQLMVLLKLGIGQPNRVSIPLTTMLIKFVVWPTIMMVQNLCLFQRTKVYICIAYLFDQNRNISKVQNPTFFFNLQARASQLAATTPTEEQQQSQQHTATTA